MTKHRKPPIKNNRRLSPSQWIEAEELYRNGWTQGQIADKFGVRIETVSRHMTKRKVQGGEKAGAVREQIQAAITKKQREFAELKAQRQIESKEMLFKVTDTLIKAFAREFQTGLSTTAPLAALAGSAKAFKDAVQALKIGREEVYAILEIDESANKDELPELQVSSMTIADEDALRARMEPDDDEEENLAESMADVIEKIDHQVEMQRGRE